MHRLRRATEILILDTLGVLCIIAALLTGWLPGPGGIPLFLIGLGLLSLNHDWAKRYIELTKKYADRLWELAFINHRLIQLAYDIITPLLIGSGVWLLIRHSALWMISLGVFLVFLGLTCFLGNRQRFQRLKRSLKKSA
jgi:hypothetical protein